MGFDKPLNDAPKVKEDRWHPTATDTSKRDDRSQKDERTETPTTDTGRSSVEALLGPSGGWSAAKKMEPSFLDFSVDPGAGAGDLRLDDSTGQSKFTNNRTDKRAENPDAAPDGNDQKPGGKPAKSDAAVQDDIRAGKQTDDTNPAAQKARAEQAREQAAQQDASKGTGNELFNGMTAAISSWFKPTGTDGKPTEKPQVPAEKTTPAEKPNDGSQKTDAKPEKPVDPITQARQDHAKAGKHHADAQENRYINRYNGKNPDATYEPGDHKNQDGSSYTVGSDGRISSFTTAKTKDNPNGLTYSNIKYDDQGVKSYDSPWGQSFTRASDSNSQGFAHWNCSQGGRPVNYLGANSSSWVGKPSFSDQGFTNTIGSGPNSGMMFGRAMDGSHVTTRPLRNGSIQTDTILPDNAQVTRTSRVENGNLASDDAHVRVRDAGDLATVDLTKPGTGNGGKPQEQSDTTRPGTKPQETKAAETEKKSDVEKQTEEQKRKDEAAKAKDAKEKLAILETLLDPQKLQMLDKVKDLHVKTYANDPHAVGIGLSLKEPMTMKAPNIRVAGPNGVGWGVPQDTQIQNVSMMVHSNERDRDRIDVTHMSGFASEADAYGPMGRRRPRRDKSGHTQSMSFNDGNLTVKATTSERPVTIGGGAFDAGSPTAGLVHDANMRKNVADGIDAVAKNLDELKIHQNSPGNFDISLDPKMSEIPLNMKLEGGLGGLFGAEATKLHLKDGAIQMNLTTNNGSPELSFKEGDVQIGVTGLGMETKFSVQKISAGKDANGKPVAKVYLYNNDKPFEVPIGQ